MPEVDRSFQEWLADEAWDEIVRDSERRLAEPKAFAAEALERLFLHENDKERGFARWDDAMAAGIWWADDALSCLRAVLAGAPPDDHEELGAWVRAHAGTIWVDGPHGPMPGDAAAHAAWLLETVKRLEAAFAATLERLRATLAADRRPAS